MKRRLKGSYTIEAAIYIPMILFILVQTMDLAIDFWQKSKSREVPGYIQKLDSVKEFYGYQILHEVGKEIGDD